jgi:hypothetical protein
LLAYVAWRAGKSNRVFEPARQDGNRFLGSLKLKSLQIRAPRLQEENMAPYWRSLTAQSGQNLCGLKSARYTLYLHLFL